MEDGVKKTKAERRERDSHLYLDPHRVWERVMGIKIKRAAWDEIQLSHFTYWYMTTMTRRS